MKKYQNDIFLRAINGEKTERPPVWLMRQAGRILPQYRAVRNKLSGFIELVTTPDLVAEVTVQPVDELEVDAAILFSDILVIPECMGLPYEMVEKKGPRFPKTIQDRKQIDALLSGEKAAEELHYVYEGIDKTKEALDDRVPLIGFSGAPFTLFCYMVEGQGSKTFAKAKKLMYKNPQDAHLLMDKITDTIIAYLKHKINHGIDTLQVFDSWAGILSRETYETFCVPYIRRIVDALSPSVPVIVFSKGAWFSLDQINELSCNAIGIDWNTTPEFARKICGPDRVLQGNLDPCILYADFSVIEDKAEHMIRSFGPHHIANLGHGVYPDTPLDNVKCFVNAVKKISY